MLLRLKQRGNEEKIKNRSLRLSIEIQFTSNACLVLKDVKPIHILIATGRYCLGSSVYAFNLLDTIEVNPICLIRDNQWMSIKLIT